MNDQGPSWTARREEFQQHAHETCQLAVLTTKDGRFWKIVSWCLFVLSAGQFRRREFLEDFATTLGPIQAYPRHWRELSPLLVVHESRHCQQFLFAGWFVPIFGWLGPRARVWCGLIPMSLAYGFFPLPVFFAWGRFRLELDAESQAWRAALQNQWMTPDEIISRARQKGELVASWSYLKSWPTKWSVKSFQRRAEQIVASWPARGQTGAF